MDKEELLKKFLIRLDHTVFVSSTDSFSGKTTHFRPKIEDMDAVIVIKGEWDREDLKDILSTLIGDEK